MIFRKICALLSRKPIESKLPDFPVKDTDFFGLERPKKKPAAKKVAAKKPAAKKVVAKKATKVAKKTAVKKK